MADRSWPQFRPAGPADADAIAELHAKSWRRHYRGVYSDSFLDGDVDADRRAVWTDRLRESDPQRCTVVADDGHVVGLANTFFNDDPTWGALLDNLHVANGRKRNGIGRHLLALTAQAVSQRSGSGGLYLWVLEQNLDAQAFYEACGGRCVGRRPVWAPGGIGSRITGRPIALRYAWTDPGSAAVPAVERRSNDSGW